MSARRTTLASLTVLALLGTAPASAPAAKAKPKTPASWTKAQKDAKALFAVLRKPATAADKLRTKDAKGQAPVASSRRIGTQNGKTYYLVLRSVNACIHVTFSTGTAAPEACVPVAMIKARKILPRALGASATTNWDVAVIVPDGAKVARTIDGTATPLTVTRNAVLLAATPLKGSVDVTFTGGATFKLPLGLGL